MSLGFDAVVEVPVVLDGQVVMLLSGGRVGPRIEPPQTLHEHRHRLTDETHETLLRRALANGEALQTTLEALLEFAHVERAGIDGGLARVEVVALVHGSVDRLSSLPAGHDVRVDNAPRGAGARRPPSARTRGGQPAAQRRPPHRRGPASADGSVLPGWTRRHAGDPWAWGWG